MIISKIYETQNLLSLQLASFLVGLRTYQHPCISLYVSKRTFFILQKNYVYRYAFYPIGNQRERYPITSLYIFLGIQEVRTTRISRQSASEGGKFVSPTHRPPLPHHSPRIYPWYSFLLDAELIPGSQCRRNVQVNEKSQLPHQEIRKLEMIKRKIFPKISLEASRTNLTASTQVTVRNVRC